MAICNFEFLWKNLNTMPETMHLSFTIEKSMALNRKLCNFDLPKKKNKPWYITKTYETLIDY